MDECGEWIIESSLKWRIVMNAIRFGWFIEYSECDKIIIRKNIKIMTNLDKNVNELINNIIFDMTAI
jgi:hypothetical protein